MSLQTLDKIPYTILGYANGPSAEVNAPRKDLSKVDTEANDFRQQSLVPVDSETHGGEDVPIYAVGPFSFVFHRSRDNTFIAHAISAALCIGPFKPLQHCNHGNTCTSNLAIIALLTLMSIIYRQRWDDA
ncbi:unnamed protein product [Protopolystoma xenopodis]|uniref:alkaline phosphatase n=1 Tax=Protopolystoma xenopodis TaxID=117903 RepID=A0A448XR87_9PLAT|nr:unnamed protein product [Protopolystoma xenopodis]